jgi:hypothetical protein
MIQKFIHGDIETDDRLFCLIGRLAVDPKLHDELGTAITSLPGDLWYLCLGRDAAHPVDGFCQVRPMKNRHWHLRFLHADHIGMKTRNALINKVLFDAKETRADLIYTNDRETAGIWKLFNFTPGEKKRGSFIRWEKTL